jgi:threonine dehydrogenase-like Zn-dependent dehydrogenase
MTQDNLRNYKNAEWPLPDKMWVWPLYGAGFENLGQDGKPIHVPMPSYGPDELLIRHDAVGLCFSDVKVIKAGNTHPRLQGRDMQKNPVILGHEVALTIVGVGANLKKQFHVGQRFIIQADIYIKGQTFAYGYVLPGGLSQYNVVGKEVLDGDEGCYLLPIQGDLPYASVALTEPWSCVEAAYHIDYRTTWQNGGVVWIIGAPEGEGREYTLGQPWAQDEKPRLILLTDVPAGLKQTISAQAAKWNTPVVEIRGASKASFEKAMSHTDGKGPDDVIILGANAEIIESALRCLNNGAVFNIVAEEPLARAVQVDVGRLHYDHIALIGTTEADISKAYQPIRTAVKAGGKAWFLGCFGPMGQMLVQYAFESPDRPKMVVAHDAVSRRMADFQAKFEPLAAQHKITMHTMSEEALGADGFHAKLRELSPEGYDDIIITAPSPKAVEAAMPFAGRNSVINIFAGLSRGTFAALDLTPVYMRGLRFTGSSGSGIDDMRRTLNRAETGALCPSQVVAAVASLSGAHAGLEAVSESRFPGKIVIYPHISELPVTSLSELAQRLPKVAKLLERGTIWTKEAEDELLRELLPKP